MKRPTTNRRSLRRPSPLAGEELASRFIAETYASAAMDEKAAIRAMVLLADQLIEDQVTSFRWDALDGAELLRRLPCSSDREFDDLCVHLLSFAVWLSLCGLVGRDRPIAVAADVLATGRAAHDVAALCRRICAR